MKVIAYCAALCATSVGAFSIAPGTGVMRSSFEGSTSSRQMTSVVHPSPTMLFGLGEKRPSAAVGTKVAEKTKFQESNADATAAAVQRRMEKDRQAAARREQARTLSGVFTPKQFEQWTIARQEVPSGGSDYWIKIAAYVPGQTPESCKKFTESQLYQKATGTQANFFKSYVEVKETKMIVDESADVMGKLNNFLFGKK